MTKDARKLVRGSVMLTVHIPDRVAALLELERAERLQARQPRRRCDRSSLIGEAILRAYGDRSIVRTALEYQTLKAAQLPAARARKRGTKVLRERRGRQR